LVRGTGGLPPKAETLLVLGHSMEAANLPTFKKFETQKNHTICVVFAKKNLKNKV